eukprot:gene2688-2629_t
MFNLGRWHVIAIGDVSGQFTQSDYFAILLSVDNDGVEMTVEKLAGVLEILFGVGFGGGDVGKGFVEEADDAALLCHAARVFNSDLRDVLLVDAGLIY